MVTLLQRDPSRTLTIRRSFVADMKRRFVRIQREIMEFMVDLDVFGLKPYPVQIYQSSIPPRAYQFRSDAGKIQAFREWLQERVSAGVLETMGTGEPWTNKYIESAWKKGRLRAYRERYGALVDSPAGMSMTDDGRLLGLSFSGAETTKSLELLYTRAWTELQGVTDTMGQQLSRSLADGLVAGRNPLDIARQMTKEVANLSRARAQLIARTEVIRSHSEGMLDSFEELGAEGVVVMAEWMTAGDEKVCEICAPNEGKVMTVDEARGLIPYHPNCRCTWAEYVRDETKKESRARL